MGSSRATSWRDNLIGRTEPLASSATTARSYLSAKAGEKVLVSVTFVAALILYLPLRSIQWDLNGITEASAVEKGGTALFSPNHMLFRPIGRLVYDLARLLGYHGNSAVVLQYVTLFFAALGIAGFALLVRRLTSSTRVAYLASFMLATSWSYWAFSTDVYYITPAACSVIWALVLLLTTELSSVNVILVGIVASAAVLLWQANVFILAFLVAGIIWRTRNCTLRSRALLLLLFVGTITLFVGAVYTSAAAATQASLKIDKLVHWMTSYGSDTGGRPAIWGQWSIRRIPSAVQSSVSSFVPLWEGLGLRDLRHGVLRPEKVLGQIALLALCLVLVASVWRAVVAVHRRERLVGWSVALLGGYCLFLPFIVWWDPFEPKWFVVANAFIIASLAAIWAGDLRHNRARFPVAIALVALIAFANLTYTVLPRHTQPNLNIELARCLAESTSDKDYFVPTDWNWFGYASYLFNYRGQIVHLMYGEGSRDSNQASLNAALTIAREMGGHVYIIDPGSYTKDFVQWSEADLALQLPGLNAYLKTPGLRCNNVEFVTLVGAQDGRFP